MYDYDENQSQTISCSVYADVLLLQIKTKLIHNGKDDYIVYICFSNCRSHILLAILLYFQCAFVDIKIIHCCGAFL